MLHPRLGLGGESKPGTRRCRWRCVVDGGVAPRRHRHSQAHEEDTIAPRCEDGWRDREREDRLAWPAVRNALACLVFGVDSVAHEAPAEARLPPVTVSGKPAATQPGALKDDVVKTETINAREIEKSGATSLIELMSHRP